MSAVNVEESELLNDSKYRSYVSQVERALKAFESTSEWADLISSLGKLNKVLSTNIKYPVIPRRVTIGKRLAQCLHPALPSGVHLKVLETYDIIFKCIGTQRLAADLFTYGAGLFPLLGYAAMNVRPSLLSLYEAHFVALRQHIKPALTGLIMGLLPGLEDGSEHSVKTAHLLEDFCDGVEPAFFYGSLWECVLSSPSNRLAAINYVLAHFNRKQSLEDQIYIIGTNINVLVESLSASLLDNNVLVQRSTLDLLLCAFPMHCNQLPRADTVSLVTAAINVVLRRDSSLNRRLYAWLIGTDSNGLPIVSNNHDAPGTDSSAMPIERQSSLSSDADLHYFETNSKSFLIQAVRNSLHDDTDGMRDSANRLASVSLRPFKILMILLDKQEIGSAILEDIFLDMLRCMHRECIIKAVTKTPSKDSDQISAIGEIVKTANLLLGGVEPSFIWQFIGKTLESACQDATKVVPNPRASLNDTSAVTVSVRELCDIVNFLLEKLSMEAYKETQTTHLPCLLLDVIQSLIAHVDHLDDIELVSCLRLASKILVNVQPALTVVSTLSSSPRRRIKQHHHNQHIINGSSTDTQHLTDTSDKEGDNSEMSDEYSASDGHYNKPAYAEYDSFCEFVQFEAGNSDSSKTEVVVETIMQKCIRNYLEFFTKFVDVHMSKSVEVFLREFVNPTCSHVEGEDRTGLKENGETENNHGSSAVSCLPTVSRLCPIKSSKDIIEAFNVACQLLIDMSALPLGHPNHNVTPSNKAGDSKVMFPQWLQRLLLSACAINQVDIEMCAVSTLLDLIVLTQSAFVSQHPSHVDQLSTTGAVRVIMKPLITVSDLSSLGSSTNFFELVATNLWNFLDERTPDCHTRAVSLLYQLHQLSPDPWTCENVISSALLSNDKTTRINAHCRFAVLWHLLRDRMTSATLISNDKPSMFDRSLLVMLDSLQRSRGDHLCSDVTQTWLLQVVERGDLIRVLEPVLILLLHPDTARVSIQHVVVHKLCHLRNVHHRGENQATDVSNATNADDTKIFAISSEGGNVIYHVSSSSKTIRCKRSTDELQAYATLMSMTGQSSSRAVHFLLSDFAAVRDCPADSNMLVSSFVSGVTTGEFDAASSSNADVLNAKLLSRVHEGTFFDDNQCTVNGDVFNVEVFVKQIIDELIERAVNGDLATTVGDSAKDDTDDDTRQGPAAKNADKRQQNGFVLETNDSSSAAVVHPLYAHILLYTHKFDTQRAIYAFDRLTAILQTSPRLVVRALTTSNVGGTGTPRSPLLQSLLAQHRRAVIGHRFHGDDVESAAAATGIRSSMFVEVLIMVSQYYLRAQYPNLLGASLERGDLDDNAQLQIMAVDILVIVLGELGNIARSGGRGFATYIVDLLDKCKVQKTVVHTLVASVHSSRCRANVVDNIVDISEAIVMFNDVPGSLSSTTLQSHLLHLMLAIIQLEYQLTASRTEPSSQAGLLPSEWDKFDASTPLTSTNVKFLPNRPVVQQPMLLLSITSALRQQHTCNLHRHWLGFVVSLLPFLGRTLPRYVTATVLQISRNLELLAPFYEFSHSCKAKSAPLTKMPPDHAVMLLDGLSTIFQYCLTDSSSQQEFGHGFNHTGSGIANNTNLDGGLLSSLASVFHLTNSREVTPNRDESSSFSPRLEARTALLKMLSRVLASLTVLWKAVHMSEGRTEYRHSVQQSCWILGSPKVIRQCVLDWISPLALNHCVHLLAAVAGVWNERRQRSSATKRAVPVSSADQLILVDIISAIKLLSLESVMQTVRLIIKQPPQLSSLSTGSSVKNVPVEVGLLRFLYAYIQRVDNSALDECWPLLLLLLRDTLQVCLSPPVIFILLNILHEFLQKIPMFEERKDQKDLQEVTQKLFESCAQVAGSSLEQTTFFRRNLAVKPGPQLDIASEVEEGIANGDVEGSRLSPPVIMDSTTRSPTDSTADYRQYSVQALQLLAEVTITLLDVVYRSDEKERVIPLLSTVLGNVFPYLKNHMMHNLPSYRACSQMLSNLSSYQYTRRAWKREVFELMMETNFFQMDAKCIASWRILIDNLMTHDRTTFKDLLVRVNLTQSSSLNLFISREAEYEQRAQLLKRLSFVIFCSEIDQYQRQMPEIQEKLADCLRMPAALPVQAQVFLCFRVLILRVSAQHLTSLWPTIITELVHVMLQLEQELTPECDVDLNGSSRLQSKNRSQTSKQSSAEVSLMNANSSADVSGTTLSPSWLSLFMAACKLLDLALVLPADFLPQFQLYRWAFTGDCGVPASESDRRRLRDQPPTFVPHVVRIGRRISAKFGDVPLLPRQPHRPLLAPNRTPTVEDVCSFFVTLNVTLNESSSVSGVIPSNRLTPTQTGNWLPRAHSAPNISQSHESTVLWTTDSLEDTKLQPMDFIEQLVLKDFTEQMQSL